MKVKLFEWKGAQTREIFKGEVDAIYLQPIIDRDIMAMPRWISTNDDGEVKISYDYPSNIRVEVSKSEGDKTYGYCRPAMTKEALDQIEQDNKSRRETHGAIINHEGSLPAAKSV